MADNSMKILLNISIRNQTTLCWLRRCIVCSFEIMVLAMLVLQNAALSQSQPTVFLGSASAFAVLAGSGIFSAGTTTIMGNIGVSRGNGLIGSPVVSGKVYEGDGTVAQAQLDLTEAYNDAAGRTTGAIEVTGNLGGQTLAPGLYASSSSLEISAGDLTLDARGDETAVFIFQMPSSLVTTTGRRIILIGDANPSNIFWQVGRSAILGSASVFKGSVLAFDSITIGTGAIVDGRVLTGSGPVTLHGNTIASPIGINRIENELAPQASVLLQNYPNPFNPSTKIKYSLESAAQVNLKIYNLLGNEVATLVNGRQEAGSYTVVVNTGLRTPALTSGVYFYRLEAGSFVSMKKLVLMR